MREEPSVWRREGRKILASKSATRSALLRSAALPMEAVAPDLDERRVEADFLSAGGAVAGLAGALASAKALVVSRTAPKALVLGADQTLMVGDRLFHKAATLADAAQTLRQLAGRGHRLTSALAAAIDGTIVFAIEDRAEMTMRALDDDAILRYLDLAGEAALQSVGAYQWEGLGVHLFSRVVGHHATILGLPLLPLIARLRDRGWIGP